MVDFFDTARMSMGFTKVFSRYKVGTIRKMISDFEIFHHFIHHQYSISIKLLLIMDI